MILLSASLTITTPLTKLSVCPRCGVFSVMIVLWDFYYDNSKYYLHSYLFIYHNFFQITAWIKFQETEVLSSKFCSSNSEKILLKYKTLSLVPEFFGFDPPTTAGSCILCSWEALMLLERRTKGVTTGSEGCMAVGKGQVKEEEIGRLCPSIVLVLLSSKEILVIFLSIKPKCCLIPGWFETNHSPSRSEHWVRKLMYHSDLGWWREGIVLSHLCPQGLLVQYQSRLDG